MVQDFADHLPIRLTTPSERQWTYANMERMKRLWFQPKYDKEKVLTNTPKDNIIKLEIGETT